MHSFRLRLILALIAGVTVVSVASTYFEVLAHKHILREELERRSTWMGASIRPQVERPWLQANASALPAMVERLKARIGVLGLASLRSGRSPDGFSGGTGCFCRPGPSSLRIARKDTSSILGKDAG